MGSGNGLLSSGDFWLKIIKRNTGRNWLTNRLIKIIIWIMACRPRTSKTFSEPMMVYCQLDHRDQISGKFNANTAVHEMNLKMPSVKWQLFCFGLYLLNAAYFVVCDWMLIRWLQPVLLLRVLFPVGYLPASWHNRSPEQLRKTGVRRVAQSDFLKKNKLHFKTLIQQLS